MYPRELPENQPEPKSRFGLHGDFPTRAMMWSLRTFPRMPRVVESILIFFFSGVVFLLARSQRKAVRGNLEALVDCLPGNDRLGFIEGSVSIFRVFQNFGWTYLDGLRARHHDSAVTWEIEGREVFESLRGGKGATLLFTTHTGNYDLAAAVFAGHFERTLHTVRIPERTEELEELRHKELAGDSTRQPNFKVHYNESQNMLGVKLAGLLADGELVAIQGDRIVGEVSALEIPVSEKFSMRVPKGPLTLAAMAKCPCVPLSIVRAGYRHYRIIFQPALKLPGQARLREKHFGSAWIGALLPFLIQYREQWFAFESAFIQVK